MSHICVAHTNLMAKGGGEGVCMTTLEALQNHHDVTLCTLFPLDWEELNHYFETAVHPENVSVYRPIGVNQLLNQIDIPLYNLQNALLNRVIERRIDEFDTVVSTDNEVSLPIPTIQYIHTPRFGRLVTTKRVGEDSFVDHAYDRLSWYVGGYDPNEVRSSVLLTNSNWMANIVHDTYDVRPRVVHPPVDTRGFTPRPWDQRENGFVIVGRIARYKRVDQVIRVIDGVRDHGHDVHLHVIGPGYDGAYRHEIERLAQEREYVILDGELSRAELIERICTHRYGIHGKRNEHFGMAVAELVAGGALPFVPDSGGQRDIVNHCDELMYTTVDDAVMKIDQVLSNPSLATELRFDPDSIERRFGRERFKETINDLVDETIEGRSEISPSGANMSI